MEENSLDKFGKLVLKNMFDNPIYKFHAYRDNQMKTASTLKMRAELQDFSAAQIATVEKLVVNLLTCSMHDFLFALHARNDDEEDMAVLCDDVNVAEKSDGLHGELFSEDGWLRQFSAYPDLIQD